MATSVGGNALAFDAIEGRVVWAAHDSFFEGLIMFKGEDGEWVEITGEHSRSSISRAVRLVDDDIGSFLPRFLGGVEEQRLNGLDLG